jgi:tRNA threonylcarbamoyl adenosine modification protein YeaZ
VILAIDTTREWGSLWLGNEVSCEEVQMHAPLGFSGTLFAEIEHLLQRSGVGLHEIECFAVAVGPGTFTGVRIGMTCAMGLAEALEKPVCGVSNLEALAEFGSGEMRAVTIDARRGDIYAAVYGREGASIVPERVCTPEEFRASLPACDLEWVTHEGPLAFAIARVARRKKWGNPDSLEANYLRRTDAELNLKVR